MGVNEPIPREEAARIADGHILAIGTLAASAMAGALRAGLADTAEALAKLSRVAQDAHRVLSDERRG